MRKSSLANALLTHLGVLGHWTDPSFCGVQLDAGHYVKRSINASYIHFANREVTKPNCGTLPKQHHLPKNLSNVTYFLQQLPRLFSLIYWGDYVQEGSSSPSSSIVADILLFAISILDIWWIRYSNAALCCCLLFSGRHEETLRRRWCGECCPKSIKFSQQSKVLVAADAAIDMSFWLPS